MEIDAIRENEDLDRVERWIKKRNLQMAVEKDRLS